MRIVRSFALAAVAVGLLTLSACSSSDTTTTSSSSTSAPSGGGSSTSTTSGGSGTTVPDGETISDPSKPIEATVGEEFTIVVESNPTTGYEWTITGEPDAAVAVATGSTPASSGPKPGQGGTQTFSFEAKGAGTTTITLTYARSFDTADNPTVQEYTVEVTA